MWCGAFAIICGFMKHKRAVDDEWNDTAGGALTTFLINVRSGGAYYAANQAFQIGVFFYLMERMHYSGKKKGVE